MKTLQSSEITAAVRALAMSASCDLEPDILDKLLAAQDRDKFSLAKNALEILVTNANIASREQIPVCQDTGIGVVFVTIGQEVIVEGNLEEAIQEGIRAGYAEGFLRKSVCDPVTRKNTGTNVPAVIHLEMVPGDKLRIAAQLIDNNAVTAAPIKKTSRNAKEIASSRSIPNQINS